jgi:hypothetical protein
LPALRAVKLTGEERAEPKRALLCILEAILEGMPGMLILHFAIRLEGD